MINIRNKYECCGCSGCQNACPRNAIYMKEDEQGFLYPKIDGTLCINCGLCTKVCPLINKKEEIQVKSKAYCAKNKNMDIRMKSSSGGTFTELARAIIRDNGVVYGATFDIFFEVKHIKVENESGLDELRGSKYIQSTTENIFREIKFILEQGKEVLFTGTPCQIEGLLSFLKRDYNNLYTQDIICHGVPSKKVWNKYLEYRKIQDGENLKKIRFRDKERQGWNNYELVFEYPNKKVYINHNEDIFMKLFLSDMVLRPSCYECKFKKKNRLSDITLADFWGIDFVCPDMNDERGTSLVIINSEKGRKLFEHIRAQIEIKEVDFNEAIKYNPSMCFCPNKDRLNEKIYEDLDALSFEQIKEKYLKE